MVILRSRFVRSHADSIVPTCQTVPLCSEERMIVGRSPACTSSTWRRAAPRSFPEYSSARTNRENTATTSLRGRIATSWSISVSTKTFSALRHLRTLVRSSAAADPSTRQNQLPSMQ